MAQRNPGPMAQSRWLTTANRILRYYVASPLPSSELLSIVRYIMFVYAPVWFALKRHPNCTEGARHYWKLVHLSRSMEKNCLQAINPTLARNAYFAHPENILISMVTDEDKNVRTLGWQRILEARQ